MEAHFFGELLRDFSPLGPQELLPPISKKTDTESRPGWWFQTFLLSYALPGKMIQFEEHVFSNGLKTPTR